MYISWLGNSSSPFLNHDIVEFHQSLEKYNPTPLIPLPELSEKYGLNNILVKDESHRFGLNAFKVLGASYAIYRFIKQKYEHKTGVQFSFKDLFSESIRAVIGEFTFCTATDGNHGRAVARTAKLIGQKAVIYIPVNSAEARVQNIRNEGAEVVLVDGSYDDAVERAVADAEENGWQVISDTSYGDYKEIPKLIMAGYTTIFKEIDSQIKGQPLNQNDIVFIQCGVGALAAAAGWYFGYHHSSSKPKMVCVEPVEADCMLESVAGENKSIRKSLGSLNTIMAGLNCGTPSEVAWLYIKDSFELFLAIDDCFCIKAMKQYALSNPAIISGESGAASLGALIALFENVSLYEAGKYLDINSNTRVILINTEGDTDPDNYQKIIYG